MALSAASYLTSLVRERYLLQHALGSSALDGAVVAYAVAAAIGNLYGIALGLIWIDGRRIPKWATAFTAYAAIGVVVAIFAPILGSSIVLGALVFGSVYGQQRAAFRSRQHLAILAAVIAPVATIALWHFAGVSSLPLIIGGYSLGYLVQSGASWAAARGAVASPTARAAAVTIAWPVAWAGLTLLNSNFDRVVFLSAGRGWPGAANFSLNLAQAAMLIVVGPLAVEAVAGRVPNQPSRRLILIVIVATVVGFIAIPFGLPWAIAGGNVQGVQYEQVRNLTFVYAVSIPAAGYWAFRARALQTGSHMWRPMGALIAAMVVVHASISVPAAATQHPLLIAAGFTVSSWFGAVMVAGNWAKTLDDHLVAWWARSTAPTFQPTAPLSDALPGATSNDDRVTFEGSDLSPRRRESQSRRSRLTTGESGPRRSSGTAGADADESRWDIRNFLPDGDGGQPVRKRR